MTLNLLHIQVKLFCLAESGEYDVALELVNLCIDSDKTSSMYYNNRAIILTKKGDYDKAIDDCNKSIALESLSAPTYKIRGSAYSGKGQYDKAIINFNKAITIDPAFGKAYFACVRARTHNLAGENPAPEGWPTTG